MGTGSSLDEMLRVLADSHRRQLLAALLEEKSEEATEVQIPGDVQTGEKELERLHVQMSHNHLPRLEEAGLIRWDTETRIVRKGPQFEEIRPLLEQMHKHSSDETTDSPKRDEI